MKKKTIVFFKMQVIPFKNVEQQPRLLRMEISEQNNDHFALTVTFNKKKRSNLYVCLNDSYIYMKDSKLYELLSIVLKAFNESFHDTFKNKCDSLPGPVVPLIDLDLIDKQLNSEGKFSLKPYIDYGYYNLYSDENCRFSGSFQGIASNYTILGNKNLNYKVLSMRLNISNDIYNKFVRKPEGNFEVTAYNERANYFIENTSFYFCTEFNFGGFLLTTLSVLPFTENLEEFALKFTEFYVNLKQITLETTDIIIDETSLFLDYNGNIFISNYYSKRVLNEAAEYESNIILENYTDERFDNVFKKIILIVFSNVLMVDTQYFESVNLNLSVPEYITQIYEISEKKIESMKMGFFHNDIDEHSHSHNNDILNPKGDY